MGRNLVQELEISLGVRNVFDGWKKSRHTVDHGTYDHESIFNDCRCLTGSLDQLQDQSHNSVCKRLNTIIELPDDRLSYNKSEKPLASTRRKYTYNEASAEVSDQIVPFVAIIDTNNLVLLQLCF